MNIKDTDFAGIELRIAADVAAKMEAIAKLAGVDLETAISVLLATRVTDAPKEIDAQIVEHAKKIATLYKHSPHCAFHNNMQELVRVVEGEKQT